MLLLSEKSQSIINRCLKTALLVDAFWDRWLVHGLEKEDLLSVRYSLTTIDRWVNAWSRLAEEKVYKAQLLRQDERSKEATEEYQKASLYYNLLQWIFPDPFDPEKQKWYENCLACLKRADHLSSIETRYTYFTVEGKTCYGRIRIPKNPDGVIIIVNPIDSSKEELYSYETDFLNQGFIIVSFDGPGQGETWIRSGFKGNQRSIQSFIDRLITYTRELTQLPIFLFGTSSGASWSLYGSTHVEVEKVVAVSPTDQRPFLNLPVYFNGRLDFILDDFELIPDYSIHSFNSLIQIYHGVKDTMISPTLIQNLLQLLPEKTKVVEYEDEGHCCNYKLKKIRRESINWFKDN